MVVTGSTRNRFVSLRAGHVGSNPTLSATYLMISISYMAIKRSDTKRSTIMKMLFNIRRKLKIDIMSNANCA